MELSPPLDLIHQPVRLRIMGLLYRRRDIDFATTRNLLGLTDGNLAGHLKRLEDAGLARSRRVLTHGGFQVRLTITTAGTQAFRDYLETLLRFVAQAQA